MVFIKRMNNADTGSASKLGGDNWDTLDKYYDDTNIESLTGKPAKIATPTEFRTALLKIWNDALTFKYSIKAGTLGANVNVFLPDLSADGTLVAAGGSNDWGTALQTFRDGFLEIRNPANSAGYIVQTSAIDATRNITIPLLAADDTFTFNNFTAELLNKTLAINLNTIKHSTTNEQGDILIYDTTSGKYIRLPRGSTGQVLKATASGIEWGTDETGAGSTLADEIKVYENSVQIGTIARKLNFNGTDFNVTEDTLNDQFTIALAVPGGGGGDGNNFYDELTTSSGFKYGIWDGNPGLNGYGLLGTLQGFDVSPSAYFSTSGSGSTWTISGSNAGGWATSFPVTQLRFNPDLTIAFLLDEQGDNSGNRFYAGFASSASVTKDSSFLDDLSGVCLFKHSDDDFFQITHNNGSGTAVEDGSIFTTDSAFHTIRIVGNNSLSKFEYSIDGGSLIDVDSEIPSSTAQLHIVFNSSDTDTTTRDLRGFWAKLKQQERP